MQIILASHGSLAEGLHSAVRLIAGDADNIIALGLDAYETPEALAAVAEKRIENAMGEHTVVLCDIKGGSVYNQLLPLCGQPNVSLITGMNLNLALELAMAQPGLSPRQAQAEAIEIAKEFIQYFDAKVLAEERKQEQEDGLW